MTHTGMLLHIRHRISIHMPHTWHDVPATLVDILEISFQSTCHIRGMTVAGGRYARKLTISIHMPHTWHDAVR